MAKARHVKANTNKPLSTNQVAASPDNDWWTWVIIGAIFAVSTLAVWAPVILGGA